MLQRRQMERSPALHLAVVSLLGFCCLIHASGAAVSFPPAAPRVQQQQTEAIPASSGADGANCNWLEFLVRSPQAGVKGEADRSGITGRMEMELEDYPGSGANGRHSPWWRQERRN